MTELRARTWGTGERVAVLVHGMTTDSGSWWHVGPMLAGRGYEDPPWGLPPGPEVIEFTVGQCGWSIEQLTAFHPRWSSEAVREKHAALALWDPAL